MTIFGIISVNGGAKIFRIGVSYDPQQYSTTGLEIQLGGGGHSPYKPD